MPTDEPRPIEVPRDWVNVSERLAQFYFTAEEIETLEMAVGASIPRMQDNLAMSRSDEMRGVLNQRLAVLNSLRTALAEGRYGLERQ